jgi:16S rRNA (guanine527-N7)-methyltransferase
MEFYNVPHGTIEKYIDLLRTWNKKVNLISVANENELIERHILDSLQLLDYIKKDDIVYDLGSGAGFPGLMLAYGGISNVNLVESNNKKASFLTVAAAFSPNKVNIHNKNIKLLQTNSCDIITARAIASLDEIFELSSHLATSDTKYLLLKGKNISTEIKKALDNWNFEYIIHESKTSPEGSILEVQQLRRK